MGEVSHLQKRDSLGFNLGIKGYRDTYLDGPRDRHREAAIEATGYW